MTIPNIFLWIVLPYVSVAIFVAGHVWRYRRDQFGWTSRSTQLLESRMLAWGSILFHYGALAAIGGHVLGILIPSSLTAAVGIDEHSYHLLSTTAGTVAGGVCAVGLLILLFRRTTVGRVRVTTTAVDVATFALLLTLIGLGLGATAGVNALGGGYEYRATVGVWFRGLVVLDPNPRLMASAPLVYQVHAALPWLLYALWPFSRLVHAWSYPIQYLGRPYILYRRRLAGARQ
jgi:nitrate reductase gamma subunit